MGSTNKARKHFPTGASLSHPSAHDLPRKGNPQHPDLASQLGDASYSCSEAEAACDDASDNDSGACDLALDGATEDELLKQADALTEEEVVRRRARRVKQLMKLYRMHYWALLEELRSKYRMFYLKNGRSGWREEAEGDRERADFMDTTELGNNDKVGSKLQDGAEKTAGDIVRCAFQGCKAKPLALSAFCFNHILSEPNQQLYKPCAYVTRSGQNGSVTCGKPVLRAAVPSFCSAHLQKQATRSIRRTNLGVSTAASKPAPKLHLVIAGYVRLIQSKRRALRETSMKCNKDNNSTAAKQHEQALPLPF